MKRNYLSIVLFIFVFIFTTSLWSTSGPVLYWISPGNGEDFYTNESNFPIVFYFYSGSALNSNRFTVSWNEEKYDGTSAVVQVETNKVTFIPPVGNWNEGVNYIKIVNCENSESIPMENLPYTFKFIVDKTKPQITSVFPNNNASEVSTDYIEINFSEPIKEDNFVSAIKLYEDGNLISSGDIVFENDDKKVKIKRSFLSAKEYTVKIKLSDVSDSCVDLANNLLLDTDGADDGYYTFSFKTAGYNPPVVSSFSPQLKALRQEDNYFVIYFSKIMDFSSLASQDVVVQDINGNKVSISYQIPDGGTGNWLGINLEDILKLNLTYEVVISNQLKDVYGIYLDDTGDDVSLNPQYEKFFTVKGELPQVENTYPEKGMNDVTTLNYLKIIFNKPMDQGSFKVDDLISTPSFNIKNYLWLNSRTLKIELKNNLVSGTTYTITLSNSNLKDEFGNKMANSYSGSFTLKRENGLIKTFTPEDGAIDLSLEHPVIVEFDKELNKNLLENDWLQVFYLDSNQSVLGRREIVGNNLYFRPIDSNGNYSEWKPFTSYRVVVKKVKFLDGSQYEGELVFTFKTKDDENPSLLQIIPENNTFLQNGEEIVLLFSEAVQKNSVLNHLKTSFAWQSYNWDNDERLVIVPLNLIGARSYLTLEAGFLDIAGNPSLITYNYSWNNAFQDKVYLVSSYPQDGGIYQIGNTMRLKFSYPLEGTDFLNQVYIQNVESGERIKFSNFYFNSNDKKEGYFYLEKKLETGQKYQLLIPSGVNFEGGAVLDETVIIDFTAEGDDYQLKASVWEIPGLVGYYYYSLYYLGSDSPILELHDENGNNLKNLNYKVSDLNGRKIYWGMVKGEVGNKIVVKTSLETRTLELN